jgi:hypothetical protein
MLLKNYQQSFQIKIDFVKFVSYRFLTVQCFRNSKTMSEINPVNYSEDNIRTLDWQEHIRCVPGCISEN